MFKDDYCWYIIYLIEKLFHDFLFTVTAALFMFAPDLDTSTFPVLSTPHSSFLFPFSSTSTGLQIFWQLHHCLWTQLPHWFGGKRKEEDRLAWVLHRDILPSFTPCLPMKEGHFSHWEVSAMFLWPEGTKERKKHPWKTCIYSSLHVSQRAFPGSTIFIVEMFKSTKEIYCGRSLCTFPLYQTLLTASHLSSACVSWALLYGYKQLLCMTEELGC